MLGGPLLISCCAALVRLSFDTPLQMVSPHRQCLYPLPCRQPELARLRAWTCSKRTSFDFV
eukprot:2989075-Amphidinium_carterae.1